MGSGLSSAAPLPEKTDFSTFQAIIAGDNLASQIFPVLSDQSGTISREALLELRNRANQLIIDVSNKDKHTHKHESHDTDRGASSLFAKHKQEAEAAFYTMTTWLIDRTDRLDITEGDIVSHCVIIFNKNIKTIKKLHRQILLTPDFLHADCGIDILDAEVITSALQTEFGTKPAVVAAASRPSVEAMAGSEQQKFISKTPPKSKEMEDAHFRIRLLEAKVKQLEQSSPSGRGYRFNMNLNNSQDLTTSERNSERCTGKSLPMSIKRSSEYKALKARLRHLECIISGALDSEDFKDDSQSKTSAAVSFEDKRKMHDKVIVKARYKHSLAASEYDEDEGSDIDNVLPSTFSSKESSFISHRPPSSDPPSAHEYDIADYTVLNMLDGQNSTEIDSTCIITSENNPNQDMRNSFNAVADSCDSMPEEVKSAGLGGETNMLLNVELTLTSSYSDHGMPNSAAVSPVAFAGIGDREPLSPQVAKRKDYNGVKSTLLSSPTKHNTLLSGSDDGMLFTWDVIAGVCIDSMKSTASFGEWSACLNSEGTLSAVGSNNGPITIQDTITGRIVHQLEGHSRACHALCFTPDGTKLISGSYDTTLRIWDLQSGKTLQWLKRDPSKRKEGHSGPIWCVCSSPDSKEAISGSHDGSIIVWNITSGRIIHVLKPTTKRRRGAELYVYSVDYCKDPGYKVIVAGFSDNLVRIWDAINGAELRKLEGHTQPVRFVSFNQDGTLLASASSDKTIRLWSPQGQLVHVLYGHASSIYYVRFR